VVKCKAEGVVPSGDSLAKSFLGPLNYNGFGSD